MKKEMTLQQSTFLQIQGEKNCIHYMRDAQKLARTRLKLGPKIRAEARTRSSSGFQ